MQYQIIRYFVYQRAVIAERNPGFKEVSVYVTSQKQGAACTAAGSMLTPPPLSSPPRSHLNLPALNLLSKVNKAVLINPIFAALGESTVSTML